MHLTEFVTNMFYLLRLETIFVLFIVFYLSILLIFFVLSSFILPCLVFAFFRSFLPLPFIYRSHVSALPLLHRNSPQQLEFSFDCIAGFPFLSSAILIAFASDHYKSIHRSSGRAVLKIGGFF